jgi:uncharacterized protein (TIGR02147 family)
MDKSVFDFRDYKKYLTHRFKNGERGGQARAAQALRCHSGYISQVLHGKAHLSLEQGDEANRFFKHSKLASQYFITLLQIARAGTETLREHFEEQRVAIYDRQLVLKNRFQVHTPISIEDEGRIYSSWHFVAIHMAVLIPELQEIGAIAEYLGLSETRVKEVLETLTKIGFVRENGNRFTIGETRAHLGVDSSSLPKHHTNWRLQALASLDRLRNTDLHYSSVVTLSQSEVPIIREILVRTIEEIRKTIVPAKDERLFAYCIDWFEVGRSTR